MGLGYGGIRVFYFGSALSIGNGYWGVINMGKVIGGQIHGVPGWLAVLVLSTFIR